jgi:hypothetical protein
MAAPILADALGDGGESAPHPGIPGLEVRASIAETAMQDPEFWQKPEFDWQKAVLVAVVGLVTGHLLARTLKK